MAKFDFLRLSLSIPKVGALDTAHSTEPPETRAKYLAEIFGATHEFFYKGSLYIYVPGPAAISFGENIYGGFIGRRKTVLEPEGPEHMFALTPKEKWQASFLAVDANPSKQIVAIERRSDVGASNSIVEHLIETVVKKRKSYSWHTDVEFITRKEEFWTVAAKMRGRITELAFTFYPANGLSGFDKFKEFDRLAKQQTNSELSEYNLKNKEGAVLPEGEFVESAVEYASEGAGKIVMKDGRKTLYNSRDSKVTEEVPEALMPREGEPVKMSGLAKNLLGRANKEGRDG